MVLTGLYGMLGIETVSAACKTNTHIIALAPTLIIEGGAGVQKVLGAHPVSTLPVHMKCVW